MGISRRLIMMLLACWGCESRPVAELAEPASVARGRALFVQHCALCHGEGADGRGVRQSGLVGKPVDFTSRAWRQRTNRVDVEQVIRDGKPPTSMAAWRVLGDESIHDLASYVLSVSGAPR